MKKPRSSPNTLGSMSFTAGILVSVMFMEVVAQ
jgi:hypothetical protein